MLALFAGSATLDGLSSAAHLPFTGPFLATSGPHQKH